MPNYSIVINSKFRPFSYDEMIKPVQAMYEQHSKIEEGLSELETKANIWEGLANEQTDEKAYKQYKKYADDLRAAADDLALNGLNASSRQNLYRMKSRYASEITPIENAYQLRAADIKAQSDLAARTGGRTVFTKSARTMSLDDYLNGMPLDYSSVNLNDVYTTTAAGTQAITKRYFSTEEGKRFQNEYYSLMQTQGISPTDTKGQNNIIQALRHSGKYPELDKFYADTLSSFGLSNFSPADQARIMQTADAGMNAGIFYDQKEQLQKNPWMDYQRDLNKMAIQHKYNKDLEDYKHSLENPPQDATAGLLDWDAPIEYSDVNYKGLRDTFFDKDGKVLPYYSRGRKGNTTTSVNPLLIKEEYDNLVRKNGQYTTYSPSTGTITTVNNRVNAEKIARDEIRKKYGNVGIISDNAYKQLKRLYPNSSAFNANAFTRDQLDSRVSEMASSYSPTSVTMSKYDQPSEKILSTLSSKDASNLVYEYEEASGKVKKSKNSSDFNSEDYEISDIAFSAKLSSRGQNLILAKIKNKDGKAKTYAIDASAHSVQAATIVSKYNNAINEVENATSLTTTEKNKLISDYQKQASAELREVFNDYDPVRGETSSKR